VFGLDSTGLGQGQIVDCCEQYNVHFRENGPHPSVSQRNVIDRFEAGSDLGSVSDVTITELGGEFVFFISDRNFKLCSYAGHFMMKSTVNTILLVYYTGLISDCLTYCKKHIEIPVVCDNIQVISLLEQK
jgi:hypothetical protein